MRFEIQGNNVSFRTGYAADFKPTEEFLKKWLPVDVFGETFYVERSDRLERIIITKENH
jgi:hypothetical protein